MNHLCSMTTRVEDYLYARRQLGFKLKSQGTQLLAFARFAEKGCHQGRVTLELALRWARDSDSAKPITAAKRIEVLRPFIRYLKPFEPAIEVPPPKLLGSTHRRPAPHIYRRDEIEALLAAAGRLRPSGSVPRLKLNPRRLSTAGPISCLTFDAHVQPLLPCLRSTGTTDQGGESSARSSPTLRLVHPAQPVWLCRFGAALARNPAASRRRSSRGL